MSKTFDRKSQELLDELATHKDGDRGRRLDWSAHVAELVLRKLVEDARGKRDEMTALRAYAHHMRDRYQAHRDHHGTEGTYPHPDSVALLEAALAQDK